MSNMNMKDFLHCNASKRPSYCKMETNTCCYHCNLNDACTEAVVTNKTKSKMLPCNSKHVGDWEVCEFAV